MPQCRHRPGGRPFPPGTGGTMASAGLEVARIQEVFIILKKTVAKRPYLLHMRAA
jgi:hypothetical protein